MRVQVSLAQLFKISPDSENKDFCWRQYSLNLLFNSQVFSFIEGKHVNYLELKIDGSSPSPGALELVVDIFDNC